MFKTITIKCLPKGIVEIESTKAIFDNETIHLKIEFPKDAAAWIKYCDIVIGSQRETITQQALSIDHVFMCESSGTLNIQPYATLEWLDIKWETSQIGIKKSLLPL
jgi:hypothetical protein